MNRDIIIGLVALTIGFALGIAATLLYIGRNMNPEPKDPRGSDSWLGGGRP